MRPVPSHPFRIGMETRAKATVLGTLAPDVVLHSPVTRTVFEGRQAVGDLLGALIDAIDAIQYDDEIAVDGKVVLRFRMWFGDRLVEGANFMSVDEQGLVHEIRILGRPMSGSALFARALGPPMARPRPRGSEAVIRLLTAPLPVLLRSFDALGSRLIRAR